MRQLTLLRVQHVVEQCGACGHGTSFAAKSEAVQRCHAVLTAQFFVGAFWIEVVLVVRGKLGRVASLDAVQGVSKHHSVGVGKYLGRFVADKQLLQILSYGSRQQLGSHKFARADVAKRNAHFVVEIQRAQVVAFAVFQYFAVHDGTGSNHTHHVTLDKLLAARFGKLFANGNLFACLQQTRDIHVHGMKRHSAHWRTLRHTAVFTRKRKVEYSACFLGVFKKHFVKIA